MFKRPLFYAAIFLSLGIFAGFHCTFIWIFSACIFCVLLRFRKRVWKNATLFLIACFLLGSVLGNFENKRESKKEEIKSVFFGRDVEIRGKIISFPEFKKRGRGVMARFQIESETLHLKYTDQVHREKFQVYWFSPLPCLGYADRIHLRGRLRTVEGADNPGEFDYREYLKRQDVRFIFQAFGPQKGYKVSSSYSYREIFLKHIFNLQTAIDRKIQNCLKEPYSAITSAMLVGVWTNISSQLRDEFVNTGLIHILSISGLHFGALCGFVLFFLLWIRIPRTSAVMITLVVVVLYAFLAGLHVPVIRSAVMIALYLIGTLMGRRRDALNILGCAAFFTLLFSPVSLWDVSFILSYGSVFAIFALTPRLMEEMKIERQAQETWKEKIWFSSLQYLQNSFFVSLAVLITLSPILIWKFQLFSPISILANFVAVPLFLLALLSGFLLVVFNGIPFLVLGLSFLTEQTLRLALFLIHALSQVSWGSWFIPRFSIVWFAIYYSVLLFTFLQLKKRFFWMVVTLFFFFPFFLLGISRLKEPSLEAVFLSTRDYRVAFFKSHGKTLLMNTGRNKLPEEASRTLIPFLRWQACQKVDGVVISSFHKKDWAGLETLNRHQLISELYVPLGLSNIKDFKACAARKAYFYHSSESLKLNSEFQICFPFHNTNPSEQIIQIQSRSFKCWYVPQISLLEEINFQQQEIPNIIWIPEVPVGKTDFFLSLAKEASGCSWVIGKAPDALKLHPSVWIIREKGAFRLEYPSS